MLKKIDNWFFNFFLIGIFFFKIPSFYILPFLKTNFLTSQALARIIFILIFLFFLFKLFTTRETKEYFSKLKKSVIVFLILLLFFIQSLSVLPAVNILSFLSRYKDVIIGLNSFFLFYFYRKKSKIIILIFLLSTIINGAYQSFLVLDSGFKNFLSTFIYQKHFDLVLAKLEEQGRVYIDSYDEILIPFLFTDNQLNLFFKIFIFLIIIFFGFFSNIRSRILMMVISLFLSFIFIKKLGFKKVFLFVFSLFIIGFITDRIAYSFFNYSFVNRVFFPDEMIDVKPINFRGEQLKNSINIAKFSFLGAGLGNYYDLLSNQEKHGQSLLSRFSLLNTGAQEYPHNIFGMILAESGYLSLIIFIFILFLFIKKDLEIIRSDDNYKKSIVISFWSLFSYGLFNPIIPGSYQVLFWGLRGLLI